MISIKKNFHIYSFILLFLFINFESISNNISQTNNNNITIEIQIQDKIFNGVLFKNPSTEKLLEKFPITLEMSDLHKNEKYFHLSENLPTNSQHVGNIRTGDLMLFGANSFVLFYKDFDTSYNYTRLGYITDVTGLESALGKGSVKVKFYLKKKI